MLRVVRDVGDEMTVDFQRVDPGQPPFAVLLRSVQAMWPELDPSKQVFIDPVSCSRVKNDARLYQIITRQHLSSSSDVSSSTAAACDTTARLDDGEDEAVVFLYDIRIISPLFVVQPGQPQFYRCLLSFHVYIMFVVIQCSDVQNAVNSDRSNSKFTRTEISEECS